MKISLKDNLKRNKGITLIALVITIIVLLILAGVSIAMLTGDNGILSKAQSAKVETDKSNEKEQIDLAVLNSKMNDKNDLSIDKQKLGDALSEIDGLTGLPSDTNYATSIIFPLEVTGKTGTIYKINGEGNVLTGFYTKTSTVNGGEASANNPTIPAGFKPIDTATSSWGDGNSAPSTDAVKNGLVISDGESEFVWIPVIEINDMTQCDQADGTCNIQADTNDGHLYCSTHSNNTNIVGKLYATSTGYTFGSTANTSYNANSELREPAIVTGNDSGTGSSYDGQYYEKAGFSGRDAMFTGLQNEYKNMATSVKKYGGFYVGRYETSLNNATAEDFGDSNSTTAQSKAGVKSANASLTTTNMWYGLYKMSKTYATENDTNKSVVSSMIWGSQYDAMMRWMQKNGINVIKELTDTPSSTLQNAVRNSSSTRVTGASDSQDILNNIYDILGNSRECTLEATYILGRVIRGSSYRSYLPPSYRYGAYPSSYSADYGSRLTLYIK